MHVYKFRILSEDQEDFLRDIEISSIKTFEDFHNIILETSGLDGKELASFHITNGKWIKLKEITLIDMMEKQIELDEESDSDKEKLLPKTYVMKDSRLKDFIDDPHQRMIYEYDFLNLKTFYIELLQISQAKDGINYPVCVRSEGVLELKKKKVVADNNMDIDDKDIPVIDDIFDNDEEDIETDSNFDLDDGFEEFKPI